MNDHGADTSGAAARERSGEGRWVTHDMNSGAFAASAASLRSSTGTAEALAAHPGE
jgi:hypothetical protein